MVENAQGQEETVVLDESTPVEDVMPTAEEAVNREEGLSEKELEMAKEHKLISEKQSDKEGESEKKPDDKKTEEPLKDDKKELRKKFLDPNADISDEEEYDGLKEFNNNEKAMYFLRKKERRKRQEAERDRDNAKAKQEIYEKELRLLREDFESSKRKPKELTEGDAELDQLLDGEGKPKEQPKEDKKYLTQEDLDKRDKEQETQRQAQIEQAQKLNERLKDQEIEVSTYHNDYKEKTDLAKEIIQKPDEIFKDNPRMIAKIGAMVRQMYATAGRALSEEQEYTAADIFYEIGKLHPKTNGKQTQTADSDAESADEKKGSAVERMLANSQKKGSSASVSSGGGTRNISVYDITPEQAARLPDSEYVKLPAAVRERLLKA